MAYTSSDVVAAATAASARIAAMIVRTPLIRSTELSAATSADVYLKLENLQITGSFKLRGASNRLLTLSPEQRAAGCVAASSGNHGAAVACAMQKLATHGVIFVPQQTSPKKVSAIRSYGGDVQFFGTDGLDTEQHARKYAAQNNMVYLSPYNDREVVAGQGTCGVELVEQLPDIDAVFVAVGGGGLISGVGSVLKAHNPNVRIYGCQPEASAVMAKSVAAGRILELPSAPTLSDGTAGGIEADAITFDLCRELIDEFVLVSEAEVAAAMRGYLAAHDEPIEGAAGVALAAVLARKAEIAGQKIAIIVCGGNVTQQVMDQVQQ
ncbi:MAG: threonine/serine dehydratase [Proteobacteria bacterium]|nr:threonine/serine dehydratase [Pseudomonadota bacterium]MDA1064644.1 threonine/serine dehydratase [Pseudomonadota bacterium]